MSAILLVYIIIFLIIHILLSLCGGRIYFINNWGDYKFCFLCAFKSSFVLSLCASAVLCLSFSPFLYLNFYLIPLGTIILIIFHYRSCVKENDFFYCQIALLIMLIFLFITLLFAFVFPKDRFLSITSLFTDFKGSIQFWVELWTPIYSR